MSNDNRGLIRCKSESNLSDKILSRMERPKSLSDVQYSAAIDQQMRDHLLRLEGDLKEERKKIVSLKRENVLQTMAAREDESNSARATQEDLVLKMLQEKNEELRELEDNARMSLHEEVDRVRREKNEELQRLRRDWGYEKEILINSLHGQLRSEIRQEVEEEFERVKKKNEMDYFNLLSENKKLQEDLKVTRQSDREKADEIRRILQDQNKTMADLKRDASKDSRRQLAEMKEMQTIIKELETKLELESGNCLRLQMEKESLDEALSRLKLADSWDKRISKSQLRSIGSTEIDIDATASLPLRLVSRPHNDPERVLHRKVIELSSLVRRLDENNQQIVARNQELVDEVEIARNALEPLEQKTKRLGAKNMELVQTQRRQEERVTVQQEELIMLKSKLKTYEDIISKRDKDLSKLKNKLKAKVDIEAQKEQVDTLENALQEQLQIINDLRQQSVEKDRRIDVLRERIQRKQSRRNRKANGKKSTSPDSLNSAFDEDSLSVSSEISTTASTTRENIPLPFDGADLTAEEKEDYSRMLKEKIEMEQAYDLLQQQTEEYNFEEERFLKQINVLQSDLLVAQTRIQDLEDQLEDAKRKGGNYNTYNADQVNDPFQEERATLKTANKAVYEKLIATESDLLVKTLEIKQLNQDLSDVEEQRDLLEFRIIELEHAARPKSPDIESSQLTDDDKINLSQDIIEEVDADAISVRIALKELEINKHSLLSRREKSALIQARNLIENGDKDIQGLQSTEKRLTRRVDELEGKYNNLKIKYAIKEKEHISMAESIKKDVEQSKELISDFNADILIDDNDFHGDKEREDKVLRESQADQKNKLKNAYKRISELEATNDTLQQRIERCEEKMNSELSNSEIDVIRVKVEELKEAKERIVQLEDLHSQFDRKLKEYETEKTASFIIEEVVSSDEIPKGIALEIEDLKEENNNLAEELSAIRNRTQQVDSFLTERVVEQTVHKEDSQTQTSFEDETPWHKYMSPRSQSRNDSSLTTPRYLCDEGTQTPRIYEGEAQSERLVIEEPLQSAPVLRLTDVTSEIGPFDVKGETAVAIDEKLDMSVSLSASLSTNYGNSSLDASSAESLFRFADNLVKEATGRAKEALLREELSLSFVVNSTKSKDDFSSPENMASAKGPGEMIDLCVNKLRGSAVATGGAQTNQSRFLENGLDYNIRMNGETESLSGKTMPLDFDPLQIETSSVDESQSNHAYIDPNQDQANQNHGILKPVNSPDKRILKPNPESRAKDHVFDEPQAKSNAVLKAQSLSTNECKKESSLNFSEVENAEQRRLETPGSIPSTDIEELLSYGAALKDCCNGGCDMTSSFDEENTLVEDGRSCTETALRSACKSNQIRQYHNKGGNTDIAATALTDDATNFNRQTENNLVLPSFHFCPCAVDGSGHYHGQVVDSVDSFDVENDGFDSSLDRNEFTNQTDSFLLQKRRGSRFGSFSSSCDGPVTGNDDAKPSLIRSRRGSQHFGDTLRVHSIAKRLRSRSLSPMERSSLARPRSHSAGSVYVVPFSERVLDKRNSMQLQNSVSEDLEDMSDLSLGYEAGPTRNASAFESGNNCAWDVGKGGINQNENGSKKGSVPPPVLPKPRKDGAWSDKERPGRIGGRSEIDSAKKEINMLREECASLERQLKNKDTIMKTMKAELKEEVENIALLEKKEKTIQEKAESNAYLTQELQRCQKEIDIKSAEINRKDSEINALKIEVKNLEISKRHTEKSYSEIQVEVNRVELAERKITDIQEQHDVVLLKNRELIERIKHLEIAEKEFIELERNVIDLQEQLRGMGDIEAHRDELYGKFQNVRRQRDEFLKKGRMVEEERNDFMRTNQTMEQHLEDYKKKYNNVKKTNGDLNRRVLVLEREKKEVETKILDVQNDRNIMQTALGKLEVERDDLIREVKEVTSERNMLEQKLAEMDEMLSDHDHLEEGFHSLRLKLAELTRQRDDAEMLIPSLKAKIALLKKACREKDETVTRHVQELKHVKYNASSSANQNTKTQRYESNKPNPRTKQKSSFFVETEHETRRHSRPRKIEYELQDGSVQLSEDDRSISEDGSILVDRRDLIDATTRAQNNRSVRVFEQQPRTRSTSSSRSKSYKAVFDYDPYKSSSSIHPERELKLKEGDYITVYGEMDVDGYLEAEVDGQTGLVPSIYVEDVDEESRNISRSNELRNVSVRSSHGQRQRKFATLYDYDPYTMGRNGRAEQELNLRKGDVVTVIGDVDVDGYYTAEINGRRGLIPSNFMRELGTSQSATSSSYGGQKLYETQSTTRTTEQRSTSGNRTGGTMEIIRDDVVGPPFPPSNLKIIRVVNKDSVLLSWKLPQMDKFGRSNGALITGYKIWVNGRTKQEVKSHTMTKAIVSGLNLKDKLDFDIQTVGENGFCSEKCLYTITNAYSLLNPIYEEFFAKAPGNYRTFVALYDYDPFKSSPNPNPSLELGFSEGDLLKVYDTSRSDGFYHAEIRAKKGLVPSNFLEEISVGDSNSMYSRDSYVANSNASEASQSSRSYSHSTQQHQRRASNSEYEKRSSLSSVSGGRKRKMVAVYDYDPLRQSPSKDKSKELNLRKGQYVTVIGDMRPDGFYLGEVDGRQGLVPGDFLEPQKDEDGDSRRVQFVAGDQVK